MKNILLRIITGAFLALALSCTKEIPQNNYPSEITIDNWEEFVNAPEELIQQLQTKHNSIREEPPAPPKNLLPIGIKDDKLLQTYRATLLLGTEMLGLG